MDNIVFAIGGSDPEMERNEALLRECGMRVVHALGPDGQRVRPADAYRARVEEGALDGATDVYLVECDVPTPDGVTRHVLDHHRPGDPGYGRPPAEFLPASSIGQVIAALAKKGALPVWDNGGHGYPARYGEIFRWHDAGGDAQWCVQAMWHGERWAAYIPHRYVLAAAADHCLGAAYRGECPGVDPDELMRWRVSTRAAFQRRPEADILADVERAREALRAAPTLLASSRDDRRRAVEEWEYDRMANGRHPDAETWTSARDEHLQSICPDAMDDVRDMRRPEPVPELVEAAARDGVAYVSGPLIDPRDPRRAKYTCSGPADVVRALTIWAPAQGMADIYGDPARGFAGGYLQLDRGDKV